MLEDANRIKQELSEQSAEDQSRFWASVRLETASEHSISFEAPETVRGYINLRDRILESMLAKLMVTDNTLQIMKEDGALGYLADCGQRRNAQEIYQRRKIDFAAREDVQEFPHTVHRARDIKEFLAKLPTGVRCILRDMTGTCGSWPT